jgi:hypothetical protein
MRISKCTRHRSNPWLTHHPNVPKFFSCILLLSYSTQKCSIFHLFLLWRWDGERRNTLKGNIPYKTKLCFSVPFYHCTSHFPYSHPSNYLLYSPSSAASLSDSLHVLWTQFKYYILQEFFLTSSKLMIPQLFHHSLYLSLYFIIIPCIFFP